MSKNAHTKKHEAEEATPSEPIRARGAKKAKLDPKEMLTLVVAHGSVRTTDGVKNIGETVQMSRGDAEHLGLGREGFGTLVTEEKWAAMEKIREGKEELAADEGEEG